MPEENQEENMEDPYALSEEERAVMDSLIRMAVEADPETLPPPVRDQPFEELPPRMQRRVVEMYTRELVARHFGMGRGRRPGPRNPRPRDHQPD